MTAVVFLGFNLLNARRGVKPTLATLGARLVVVIRSCWIFACCLPGRPLSCCCWPPPAAFPLVLFRSLASFARLAAVVCLRLLFGAPLFWPFVVFFGVVFVCFFVWPVFCLFCWWFGGLCLLPAY